MSRQRSSSGRINSSFVTTFDDKGLSSAKVRMSSGNQQNETIRKMTRSPGSGSSIQQFMCPESFPAAFRIGAHVTGEDGNMSWQVKALRQCRRRHNHLRSIRPSEHPLSNIPL